MSAHSEPRVAGLVLSCEHARNDFPARYRHLLRVSDAKLRSHAAYDPGALEIARALARRLLAPLIEGGCTRLLVDLNRPERAAFRHSKATAAEREELLRSIHRPHWSRVRAALAARPRGTQLHLGCHTFTPLLRGRRREMDLGLLYDPSRPRESAWVARWLAALREELPELRIRRNAPYRGNAPGMTTSLRAELPPERYLGVELECNQDLWRTGGRSWNHLLSGLGRALERSLD